MHTKHNFFHNDMFTLDLPDVLCLSAQADRKLWVGNSYWVFCTDSAVYVVLWCHKTDESWHLSVVGGGVSLGSVFLTPSSCLWRWSWGPSGATRARGSWWTSCVRRWTWWPGVRVVTMLVTLYRSNIFVHMLKYFSSSSQSSMFFSKLIVKCLTGCGCKWFKL